MTSKRMVACERKADTTTRSAVPLGASPALVLLGLNTLLVLALATLPEGTISRLTGGLPRPSGQYIVSISLVIIAGIAGWLIALNTPVKTKDSLLPLVPPRALASAAHTVGALAVLGYAVLALAAVARGYDPSLAAAVLSGDPAALQQSRIALRPIPGVTTLVAFSGPVVCALLLSGLRNLTRAQRWMLYLLVVGALCRGFFNAERLAVIEVGVALFVAFAAKVPSQFGRRMTIAGAGFSAVAVSYFVVAESLRPAFAAQGREVGTLAFGIERLYSYYISSTVNGYYYSLDVLDRPAPRFMLDVVWNAPGMSWILTPERLYGFDSLDLFDIRLTQYLEPGLNTVGMIPSMLAEFGLYLSMIVMFVACLVMTRFFRARRLGLPTTYMAYAIVLTGCLESLRYAYFVQARFLIALAAVWVIARLLRREGYLA